MPTELIQLGGQVGTWVIFLYLYLSERKRNSEIQDDRMKDCRGFQEALIKIIGDNKSNQEQQK